MKNLSTILFMFLGSYAVAQKCKCEDEFNFVVNYYEENLPGFIDNVNETNLSAYNEFRRELSDLSKDYCDDKEMCFKTLLVYVEYFKDNHSSIYMGYPSNVDRDNEEQVNEFIQSDVFKNREIINEFKTTSNAPIESLENVYQTEDGTYTVVILENKTTFRDYVGVIMESNTPLWKQGQVKFELKKVGEHTYDMLTYMENHLAVYHKNVKLKKGILNDTWFNISLNEKNAFNLAEYNELLFKQIDQETNYMYIPTFDGNQFAEINDFYQKHDSLIQSKPYLIIDVRGNGGGSDACVSPLLEYIYTRPFKDDEVEVYATESNIRKFSEWYDQMETDTLNFDREFLKEFAEEIERMKAAPNKSFIPRSEGDTIELDHVLSYPKEVAVITNKHCASSCETLLFLAMESDKTIIVGENSGGYVGYGENGLIMTPNFDYLLTCTMTRYNKQRAYEVIGVPPHHYLNNEEGWIMQTLELLKK